MTRAIEGLETYNTLNSEVTRDLLATVSRQTRTRGHRMNRASRRIKTNTRQLCVTQRGINVGTRRHQTQWEPRARQTHKGVAHALRGKGHQVLWGRK